MPTVGRIVKSYVTQLLVFNTSFSGDVYTEYDYLIIIINEMKEIGKSMNTIEISVNTDLKSNM